MQITFLLWLQVFPLSSLLPPELYANNNTGLGGRWYTPSSTNEDSPIFQYSTLCSWIEVHLSLNDVIYPSPSASPAPASPGSPTYAMAHNINHPLLDGPLDGSNLNNNNNSCDISQYNFIPKKEIYSISELSTYRPLLLSGFASTFIYLIQSVNSTSTHVSTQITSSNSIEGKYPIANTSSSSSQQIKASFDKSDGEVHEQLSLLSVSSMPKQSPSVTDGLPHLVLQVYHNITIVS